MNNSSEISPDTVRAICAAHAHRRGPTLEILHALQREFGFVPSSALPVIAEELNVTRAEVHGVFSFYHDLRDQPPPRHTVRVCRAEACQSMGARAVWDAAQRAASTTPSVEVSEVFCLGNCACSPAIQVDERTRGRMDPGRVTGIIEQLDREAS
ncbi:NAD(P)H-dependent oxidoreductase subunit E [Aquisalimonas lutea]|uniref:NAD(P)H-dependent oxidoreductase subunit E n=1 Tax=Aquisalimonas lutea TaxID=1327750 RepID=UPI0025B3B92A|nr:NAD(P)H-dependent oxidoreductase subunit E [Aquisalimonas lutea]MDN3517562.1 NAD(P)H-dependent oxidoreductase subunit E [Aquisalimonas lutea]